MKRIYTGIESCGKSLLLAKDIRKVVDRNIRWHKITGKWRTLAPNMALSPAYIQKIAASGQPIKFWRNLHEIIYDEESDVFIDEILKYFDARNWDKLSLDAKHWLSQGAKMGINVYGACQDFSQVDKSFRLLCNEVYLLNKVIGSRRPSKTTPPVKKIWGLCLKHEVDPLSFKGDNTSLERKGWFPTPFFIHKEDCDLFDTNAKVVPTELPPFRHEVRHCEDAVCGHMKVFHT